MMKSSVLTVDWQIHSPMGKEVTSLLKIGEDMLSPIQIKKGFVTVFNNIDLLKCF